MRLAVLDPEKCVGCQCCMFACTRIHKDAGLGKSCIGIKSAGGMQHGFMLIVCRACEDPPCARACPEDALVLRKGGGVLLKAEKCTGCGICRQACILGAVFWDDANLKPLICWHCGYCAQHCPYGVIGLEKEGKPQEAAHAQE